MWGNLIKRLVLFVDDKNIWASAREAFFAPSDPRYYGQYKPIELGHLICTKAPPELNYRLHEVRIYTGRPDANKDPRTHAAHMRQSASWTRAGARIFARPLRYPRDWPNSKPQQKGVDVALAVDFVAMAVRGEYDVGVVFSTDSDLKPALEFVAANRYPVCTIETATWRSNKYDRGLSVAGLRIWQHRLDYSDYCSIADLVNYGV